ncbi:hypothetical protein ACROYT_G038772 [Oculina patagonica]
MDFFVDYSCKHNSETGRTKLTVSDFDTTSIRDVKYAIQDAIQAPVCDQQLFYQGQPVTDDDMPLSRLYFREGDCFKLQFLAAADITGMTERLNVLKNFAQEICKKLNGHLSVLNIKNDPESLRDLRRFRDFSDQQINACRAIQQLTYSYFSPWKCLRTVAQRHFFVQEEGFDAFFEVFKFSWQHYHDLNVDENSEVATRNLVQLQRLFNQGQLLLQFCCLGFLRAFGETSQDLKFLLSKDVFSLMVDALLLQPYPPEDTDHIDLAKLRIVGINENALGCCGGLIEYDSNIQEEVSKMSPLIDKLIFMIDRCQSEPAGYSLYSSEVASITLFCCTFNLKSAQPLVDCGALDRMINITKKLLTDKDSETPQRYYCCLFLARMRSAPLVTLDRATCIAIDIFIDMFLNQHIPSEISKWEEENSIVWITMVPLVHLAFAAGKEYYCDKINYLKYDGQGSESQSSTTITELDETGEADKEDCFNPHLSLDNLSEQTSCKQGRVEGRLATPNTLCDTFGSMAIDTSVSGNKNCAIAGKKDQFTWPGSTSTLKLGIFSLVHMLSIKENQKLALSENLLSYLVCLSWHLRCDEREKLMTSLANFHNATTPPSLKVAAKSVLALVNGLDMVFKL